MKKVNIKSTLLHFIRFIEGFLNNEISFSIFFSIFRYMFIKINIEQRTYDILNELFWALEDYVEDPELREEGDLDEEQVREVARRVLEKLKKYYEELNR